MKCEKGLCLICEKVISVPCETCGNSWRNTGEYTHVQLVWSNGSKMDVAVCIGCAQDSVWKADKALITKAIWDAWDKLGAHYDKNAVIA